MYVNPFIAGILVTLGVELAFIVIYSIQQMHRAKNCRMGTMEVTGDELREILNGLEKSRERRTNGEDNID